MSTEYIGVIALVYDDHTQFVLNKGWAHGVQEHHRFIIFELGNEVIDPETGENLGTLEIIKGRVRPLHIQEKITTLISEEITKSPVTAEYIYRNNSGNRWAFGLNNNLPASKIVSEEARKIKPLRNVKIGDKVKINKL
ncbi:hypothetical protein V1572_14605 [Enterobacter quasiroggenkampii]|uniref:hypothetical protein n=1 Tax=Enterobacter quasiroggenkampii TaxID=2497436 RepID=UPI00375480D4